MILWELQNTEPQGLSHQDGKAGYLVLPWFIVQCATSEGSVTSQVSLFRDFPRATHHRLKKTTGVNLEQPMPTTVGGQVHSASKGGLESELTFPAAESLKHL